MGVSLSTCPLSFFAAHAKAQKLLARTQGVAIPQRRWGREARSLGKELHRGAQSRDEDAALKVQSQGMGHGKHQGHKGRSGRKVTERELVGVLWEFGQSK